MFTRFEFFVVDKGFPDVFWSCVKNVVTNGSF